MTLVDDQGRLFGRWNVVDGVIGVVLLGLIPLLYGAFVLFRPTPASLVAIEPARIMGGTADITIRGNNLRPYMRVSFGTKQGSGFLFESSEKAIVPVSQLAPGVYDVILYDDAQERGRLPKALEVVDVPHPIAEIDLIGAFTGVADVVAKQLKTGLRLEGIGEVTQLGKPVSSATRTLLAPGVFVGLASRDAFNVPAIVRAACSLVERNGSVNCMVNGVTVMEDAALQTVLPTGAAIFQIDQLRTVAAMETVTVHVRFAGDRAVLDRLREGDRDVRRNNEFAAAGTIASVGAVRAASTSVGVAIPASPTTLQPFVATDLAFRDAVLRLPAQRVEGHWHYAARPLLIGSIMNFSGPGYEVRATVTSIEPSASAKP